MCQLRSFPLHLRLYVGVFFFLLDFLSLHLDRQLPVHASRTAAVYFSATAVTMVTTPDATIIPTEHITASAGTNDFQPSIHRYTPARTCAHNPQAHRAWVAARRQRPVLRALHAQSVSSMPPVQPRRSMPVSDERTNQHPRIRIHFHFHFHTHIHFHFHFTRTFTHTHL